MENCFFRLTDNVDPEERLEEAAMWKAMRDQFGDLISPIHGKDEAPDGAAIYGRPKKSETCPKIDYWNDEAFLRHCRREFKLCDLVEAKDEVERLHRSGKTAFIKATRSKFWIDTISPNQTFDEVMSDIAYSFIDCGRCLMVQEFVTVEYEWRFFVCGRRIVADSSNAAHLTPIDYPLKDGFLHPSDTISTEVPDWVRNGLRALAGQLAATAQYEDIVIDCAMINGGPGCVEYNPLVIGGVGLFASDVRAIAAAAYNSHPRLAVGRPTIQREGIFVSEKWGD